MKALSLWQPWAQLVVLGKKRIETRSWMTTYTGPLLIHASATTQHDPHGMIAYSPAFNEALGDFKCEAWSPLCGVVPTGAIIGCVDVRLCLGTTSEALARSGLLTDQERAFGDFSEGRYGWLLENPVMFSNPIKYRGRQRLFEVPDSVVASALATGNHQLPTKPEDTDVRPHDAT